MNNADLSTVSLIWILQHLRVFSLTTLLPKVVLFMLVGEYDIFNSIRFKMKLHYKKISLLQHNTKHIRHVLLG
jgi:hypothetical protein